MIAALYVERGGPYFNRADCDPWDLERDATKYDGPWPVVAHPPCGPWGRLRHLYRRDEHRLAPLAVEQVRRWGGVLEHPAWSLLWGHCLMPIPGALFPDKHGGYSLEVCQVDWGHVAEKRTWLYLVDVPSSVLVWPPRRRPTHWIVGNRGRVLNPRPAHIKCCSAQQRRRTPLAFAQYLVELARAAGERRAAA